MRSWELFRYFLFSRRAGSIVRSLSLVSMAAICLGTFSLILVTSVMNGLGGSVVDRMLEVEPKLTVSLQKEQDWISSQADLEKVLQDYTSRGVTFYASQIQDVVIRTGEGGFGGCELKGIPQQEILRLIELGKVNWADPLRAEGASLGPGEVLVGSELAQQLEIYEGDEVTVLAPEGLLLPPGELPPLSVLKVAGVLTTSYEDFNNKTVVYSGEVSIPRLMSAAGIQRQFEIRWDSDMDHKILENVLRDQGWKVESWADRNATLVFALRMERNLVGLLLGLAALIASFSVITVMTLLLTQKKKDMAIMMVLGLSPRKMRSLFSGVGYYMCLIALFTGGAAGILGAILVGNFSGDLLPPIYHDQSLPAVIRLSQVALILGGATIYSTFVVAWVVKRQSIISPAAYLSVRKASN